MGTNPASARNSILALMSLESSSSWASVISARADPSVSTSSVCSLAERRVSESSLAYDSRAGTRCPSPFLMTVLSGPR